MIANASSETAGGFSTLFKGFLIIKTKENEYVSNEVAIKYLHVKSQKQLVPQLVHKVRD